MKPKILYAEDDQTLAFLTTDNLEQNGFDVVHCSDGQVCLEAFAAQKFDICVFDIMMPKLDGFGLAARVREMDREIPIIFLSAKTLKEDRIKGLRLGADDYLVKPFSIEELVLKIEVFLKRSKRKETSGDGIYNIGSLRFDSLNYTVTTGGKRTTITQRESELLKYFIENRNTVLKREAILKAIWGDDDYFMGRSLDVFISRLRKIIADQPATIENLHGTGFRFLMD